ncbi:MAG: penicillin-binding protein, partial [Lachnospira sp.]
MKEVFDYVVSLLKSRIFPMILVFIILISILVHRLFVLQIIKGDSYVEDLSSSIQKDMSVAASRGRIYDRNGVLLAYNDLSYAVKISDSGRYSDNATKNKTINNSINKTLDIIENHGDTFSNDLPIIYTNGQFSYNVEGTSLLRFIRDSYGVESISALTDEQKATSAENMFKYLCKTYSVNYDEFGIEHSLMIVNLRRYMAANSYNRYMSFSIANEVSDETVAAILENSDELVGVTVEEQYIRRYVDSIYCSQILGYTGTISNAELEELGSSYESNDIVGKSGIEKSMENELAGKKGEKTVYVDTVGRITEVLDEEAPEAGHDVYLTIDINLQKAIYNAIEDELTNIFLTYYTSGNNKVTYDSSGEVDKIYITAQEVYFALIDNNLVSLKKIEAQETDNEADIYNQFINKKTQTLSWLKHELTSGNTPYGKLTEEQQLYIWYIYTLLRSENIFSLANVDTSDSVYSDWINGNSTSLQQLLTYGISKNWID